MVARPRVDLDFQGSQLVFPDTNLGRIQALGSHHEDIHIRRRRCLTAGDRAIERHMESGDLPGGDSVGELVTQPGGSRRHFYERCRQDVVAVQSVEMGSTSGFDVDQSLIAEAAQGPQGRGVGGLSSQFCDASARERRLGSDEHGERPGLGRGQQRRQWVGQFHGVSMDQKRSMWTNNDPRGWRVTLRRPRSRSRQRVMWCNLSARCVRKTRRS